MSTFVIEDNMLDWHSCQICFPLEIKLLLLLLLLPIPCKVVLPYANNVTNISKDILKYF